MENKIDERLFAELAQAYAANEGAAAINELAEIEAENRLLPTSGLERKIKSKKSNHKFRSYSLRTLPLAASLIIAVLVYSSYKTVFLSPSMVNTPLPAAPPQVAMQPDPVLPLNTQDTTPLFIEPSPELKIALVNSVELVSASLPAGYAVTGVDYDNAAAIMEITTEQNNRIVLLTEVYQDFDTEGYSKITVNGSPAYGQIKSDYCVLKYQKDDMLYTLTSMYDYGDLVEIIENI